MRKTHIRTALVVLSVIVLNACNKDTDIFIADPGQITGPDSTWYASISASMPVNDLKASLLLAPDIDSIQVDTTADTILFVSGLKCIFPVHSCVDTAGMPVTGKVSVRSYLLKNKGQLISMGLPTSSGNGLLVSGGAFSIHLKKDNNDIKLAPGANVNIGFDDTDIASQDTKLFDGGIDNYGQFGWTPETDIVSNTVMVDNNDYKISSNHLNWISPAVFYDTTGIDETTISVKLPSSLTNANSVVYAVFSDIHSVISLMGDAVSKKFISGRVPVNKNVTIVTISKDGNFYYLGQQNIVTALPAAGIDTQAITIIPARYLLNDIKLYLASF